MNCKPAKQTLLGLFAAFFLLHSGTVKEAIASEPTALEESLTAHQQFNVLISKAHIAMNNQDKLDSVVQGFYSFSKNVDSDYYRVKALFECARLSFVSRKYTESCDYASMIERLYQESIESQSFQDHEVAHKKFYDTYYAMALCLSARASFQLGDKENFFETVGKMDLHDTSRESFRTDLVKYLSIDVQKIGADTLQQSLYFDYCSKLLAKLDFEKISDTGIDSHVTRTGELALKHIEVALKSEAFDREVLISTRDSIAENLQSDSGNDYSSKPLERRSHLQEYVVLIEKKLVDE